MINQEEQISASCMIKLEEVTNTPAFSSQLENKMLYADHSRDISISYQTTYTLKYVIEGEKQYYYNQQRIKVSKNQYLLLNAGNKITTKAKKGTKGLSLFLAPRLIDEIYGYHTNTELPLQFLEVPQENNNSHIAFLLTRAAQLYREQPDVFKQEKEALFIRTSELIVQEQMALQRKFGKLKIVKHDTKKELYKLAIGAREYLHDHYKEQLSLERLSKDIGMSKYYLHRLFTEIYGRTPQSYLTAIRLEKARYQLQNSAAAVMEIAVDCGFDTVAYFSNTFKKHTGYTPSQFRKQN
ncbi:helix-turn-helix transcriptional regulator [Aquimarina sp. TRL1]|uniref:helix-turn-helix transcriptional regulator n=1 Tax=Aquimarina sp. (strain TRL1) TaxID=2736252 RepID=UPI001C379553|nr:AraC family transcriptional regulator [Aquimarina sp. TRL1]